MTYQEYAKKRGISLGILERFGVKGATPFFGELGRKELAIAFPYEDVDGKPVGAKARCLSEKAFTQREGSEAILWNLPAIVRQETVYICEGEFDAMSLAEAGIDPDQVTTVPNASTAARAVDDALGKGLDACKKFILCGDNDEAGLSARKVIVQALGPARCWFVDWPHGIKDANEFLTTAGPEGLLAHLETAQPWPVRGLYSLDELPEPPPLEPWDVFPEWESKLKLAAGTLVTVIGHPGHGKSHLMLQSVYQIAARYGIKSCVASMETQPKPHARRLLRSFRHKRLEKDMTPEQIDESDDFIREHFKWIQHPEHKPTIEFMLEMAEVAVIRHGVKIIMVDPWNKLESHTGDDIDTRYIGRALDSMYDFAHDFNVCWINIVHPTKLGTRAGQAPLLEDAAGSKHWDNRSDQGIVVHGDDGLYEGDQPVYERSVYVRKARYPDIGRPCKLSMRMDPKNFNYVSTDYERIKGLAA